MWEDGLWKNSRPSFFTRVWILAGWIELQNMSEVLSNGTQFLILFDWLGCGAPASKAVILGALSYILVPAGKGLKVVAPLERRNACDRHLFDINFSHGQVPV